MCNIDKVLLVIVICSVCLTALYIPIVLYLVPNLRARKTKKTYLGRVIINMKDPHKETMRLEFDCTMNELLTKEELSLEIVREE